MSSCCQEKVFFAEKPGVAGQDDIAMTLLTQQPHLQMLPNDLHRFYRLFIQLEDHERDIRAKKVKCQKDEVRRVNLHKNEFDADVVVADEVVIVEGEIHRGK